MDVKTMMMSRAVVQFIEKWTLRRWWFGVNRTYRLQCRYYKTREDRRCLMSDTEDSIAGASTGRIEQNIHSRSTAPSLQEIIQSLSFLGMVSCYKHSIAEEGWVASARAGRQEEILCQFPMDYRWTTSWWRLIEITLWKDKVVPLISSRARLRPLPLGHKPNCRLGWSPECEKLDACMPQCLLRAGQPRRAGAQRNRASLLVNSCGSNMSQWSWKGQLL